MGEYFPLSPENKNAEEYNKNLPGLGGVFNSRNLQTYHYGGNNPIKYADPTGRNIATVVYNDGAAGAGHMGIVYQDEDGNWWRADYGSNSGPGSSGSSQSKGTANGSNLVYKQIDGADASTTMEDAIGMAAREQENKGNVSYVAIETTDDEAGYEARATIHQSVQAEVSNILEKEKNGMKYNIISNNCADISADILERVITDLTGSNNWSALNSNISKAVTPKTAFNKIETMFSTGPDAPVLRDLLTANSGVKNVYTRDKVKL